VWNVMPCHRGQGIDSHAVAELTDLRADNRNT
jgi:hypothetical protein